MQYGLHGEKKHQFGKEGTVDAYDLFKDTHPFSTPTAMRQRADELNEMFVGELTNLFTIHTFKEFEAGTVFVYSKLRYLKTKKESAKVPVVAFKRIKPDGSVGESGEIFVSAHTLPQIKKHAQGLLIYKGQQRTKCGNKTYFLTLKC